MQGIEEKFRKSVEQCLSLYDKYENYKQDLRMVKLWIKYIDFQPNKPNLYKILYQQGIGTKCAAFYIAWAHYYNYYNSDNSLKQAESIYNLGLQLKAEPLHELETAQKNFRYSVAQRMLYNDESSKKRTISSLAEQRQQITSLELSSPPPTTSSGNIQQPALKKMRTDSSSNVDSYGGHHSQFNEQQQQQNEYDNSYNNQQYFTQQQQHQNYQYQAQNDANYYDYNEIKSFPHVEKQQQQQPVSYTFECGFKPPINFISYANNSNEPWDGLLFLEEPFDPNRRCFYPKNQVYPGDGTEYSLEELMGNKWRLKMEEKRKREEAERLRLEQERERLRQEQEAQRVRLEQQERMRREQEAMRIKMEQQRAEAERIRKQQEEEQKNRYQMYQQQQWNNYHSPVNYGSPAPYHQYNNYENSPQYTSHSHDHQYQTHYQQSPHNHQHYYQNSPNYYQHHQYQPPQTTQQSVIVNRNQYGHNYYSNYAPHHQQHQQQQHVQHSYEHHHIQYQQSQQTQQYQQESDFQDVEYLIDHQAEIDPMMLKQPIIENSEEFVKEESEDSEGEEEEDVEEEETDEEQIPTIVNSYMLDDLEEQIEASTISFSSNGKSRDKKITIKFRKEKTIIANDSNSSSSQPTPQQQQQQSKLQKKSVPLETTSTSSSSSTSKKRNKKKSGELLTSFDGENTQFMPSATNSNSSTNNGDQTIGKITFNGCITPVRKQAASKTSTPVSTCKFLNNKSSFLSNQNDESFLGDQNSFFQADDDDDYKSKRYERALATIEEHFKKRDVDPFNSELCRAFLTKINFPSRENSEGYKVTNTNLPKFTKNQIVPIGGVNYQLEKEVGRGSYGYVYR